MQSGNISFCDKTALNIKSNVIKKQILETLEQTYFIKILQKHHDNFNEQISIPKLKKKAYLCSLKSNGNPYFMYLTKINHVNTCVLIDKKIQQGYYMPRMIIVRLMMDDELFEDTLFDGEMVKDKNSEWIYIINDIFTYKGKYLIDMNLIKRLNIIYNILLKQFMPDDDLFHIQVKKYFQCHEIEYVCEEFKNKLPYSVRGAYFKPMFFKFKDILMNFDDSLIKSTKRIKYSEKNEFIENGKIDRKLKIKQTEVPDIYNLYDCKSNELIGNACVNKMETSKFLSELFKESNSVESFIVNCRYNEKFEKWIPLSIV
jgi:hypothetical protein